MQIRVLGPVDVVVDGASRPVRGLRRKAVLAVLALHRGEIVSTDRLIDLVWNGTAPATALNTLQSHVSHLRHVLGSKTAILARPPGYLLDLGQDATDLEVAERLIERGQRGADHDRSAADLRAALALWRGRPLVDVTGLTWLDEQADRLEQLRVKAEQALLETRLALGEHDELIPELIRLARQHPFDEQLHGKLMLALYRSGRQADALRTFQRLRHKLREDLGIDPSQAVRELEAAILRQDAALDPPARGDTASLLADGARALGTDGDLLASRRHFEKAYAEAELTGDSTAAAVAAIGLCGLWVHEDRSATGSTLMRDRLRHVLSLVEPGSSLALRLRIRLAGETDYRAATHGEILAMLEEARVSGDQTALVEALSLAHHCLLGPEHGVLRRKLAIELTAESFRTGRRSDLLMGLLWVTVDLFLAGEPHARRRLGELREMLARQGNLAIGFAVTAIDVMLAIRDGRFETAEHLAQVCAEQGTTAGDVDVIGWYGGHLFAIRWFQGRVAELLPMLDELVHSPTLSVIDNSWFAGLAVAAAAAGDRRKAAGALATLSAQGLANVPRSSTWLVTMGGVIHAANLLGDATIAAQAYELLAPFAALPVIGSLGVVCFGSAHHPLGVAALTTGDLDRAIAHFEAAIQADLAQAHWPAVIASRLRYAEALSLRDKPGDSVAAQREQATAAEETAALGIALPGLL